MGRGQWGDQRDFLVGHRHPGGAELLDNATPVDRIPHQDRIPPETQATRLVHHLLIGPRLQRPLMRKKEPAGELMAALAPVELALDLMAEVRVLGLAEARERGWAPAQKRPGLGQSLPRRPPP